VFRYAMQDLCTADAPGVSVHVHVHVHVLVLVAGSAANEDDELGALLQAGF